MYVHPHRTYDGFVRRSRYECVAGRALAIVRWEGRMANEMSGEVMRVEVLHRRRVEAEAT